MPEKKKAKVGKGTYQNDSKDKAIETSMLARDILANLRQRLNVLNQEYLYKQTGLSTPLWYKYQNSHLNAFNSEVNKQTIETLKNAKNGLIEGLKAIGLNREQRNELLDATFIAARGMQQSMVQRHQQQIATVSVKVNTPTLTPSPKDDGVTTRTLESKRLPPIFEEIKQMQQLHPDGDFGYVTDSAGRTMSWETYIERKIRTEASQEIATNMTAYGYQTGEVFYICSEFGDCAKDHVDYQGKIYFDKDWEDNVTDPETKKAIQDRIAQGMMSVQDVMGDDIWLTTRPNCRHYFQYISIEDVLGIKTQEDLKKALNERDMAYGGKYQPEKYAALQKQRYNERNIRKYKERLELSQVALANAPKDISVQEKNRLIADVSYNKSMVSSWQKAQRKLINNNSHLARQYKRESVTMGYQKFGQVGVGPNVEISGSGGISTKIKPVTLVFNENDKAHPKIPDYVFVSESFKTPEYEQQIKELGFTNKQMPRVMFGIKQILSNEKAITREGIYLLDLNDLRRSWINRDGKPTSVKRPPAATKYIDKHPEADILVIHNHRGDTIPSPADFHGVNYKNCNKGLIIGNKGTVYYYHFNKKLAYSTIEAYNKDDDDCHTYEERLELIKKFAKDNDIEFIKVRDKDGE